MTQKNISNIDIPREGKDRDGNIIRYKPVNGSTISCAASTEIKQIQDAMAKLWIDGVEAADQIRNPKMADTLHNAVLRHTRQHCPAPALR